VVKRKVRAEIFAFFFSKMRDGCDHANDSVGLFGRASRPANARVQTNGYPTHSISVQQKGRLKCTIFLNPEHSSIYISIII
jgi:hypothetical protein